mmetsp:Transcript_44736/g.96159  ORF Transcript_44736/g.96159 Transcript_44736/m.96159 type:complete len:208 (-) Transcript_44736:74-697(-)|eukprot:CAMPEP_0206450340 /NCGR_PEP_ID=MMETSP0324_2-20121206/18665_1 /ASSEMBLY_ACC=CAM_ASM_000836 /TAXON_ID=2866 /ORGANISM="Crypthecodinium cohnii, Strain Seligo" /LENGTH=207 /DNA_ID=CAMNT_0053919967 /DNA_START=157 /DNA_END=783 /DNA_ORIENTATION=-
MAASFGPYDIFTGLPTVRAGLLSSSASSGSSAPHPASLSSEAPRLDLDDISRRAKDAFELASKTLKEQEQWREAAEAAKSAREDRKAALKVPDASSSTAAAASGARPPAAEHAAGSKEAILHIEMPNGRVLQHNLKANDSMFEVQGKVYQEIEDKSTDFEIFIKGPRGGGAPSIDRKFNVEDVCKTVEGFGIEAGKNYDAKVTQYRR